MHEIIEYIWSGPSGNGVQREKKGVMVGFVEPGSNTIAIGVSLCCGLDKFDYRDGKKVKGFGLNIARERARKHVSTEWIKVHGVTSIPQELRDQGDADGIWIKEVKIPASLTDSLRLFVDRCTRYFKDQRVPTWVDVLNNEDIMLFISDTIKVQNAELDRYYENLCCEVCLDDECPGC